MIVCAVGCGGCAVWCYGMCFGVLRDVLFGVMGCGLGVMVCVVGCNGIAVGCDGLCYVV